MSICVISIEDNGITRKKNLNIRETEFLTEEEAILILDTIYEKVSINSPYVVESYSFDEVATAINNLLGEQAKYIEEVTPSDSEISASEKYLVKFIVKTIHGDFRKEVEVDTTLHSTEVMGDLKVVVENIKTDFKKMIERPNDQIENYVKDTIDSYNKDDINATYDKYRLIMTTNPTGQNYAEFYVTIKNHNVSYRFYMRATQDPDYDYERIEASAKITEAFKIINNGGNTLDDYDPTEVKNYLIQKYQSILPEGISIVGISKIALSANTTNIRVSYVKNGRVFESSAYLNIVYTDYTDKKIVDSILSEIEKLGINGKTYNFKDIKASTIHEELKVLAIDKSVVIRIERLGSVPPTDAPLPTKHTFYYTIKYKTYISGYENITVYYNEL